MRNVTVSFVDGSTHQYSQVPDNVTPEQITERVSKEFSGQAIANIDGGRQAPRQSNGATGDWVEEQPAKPIAARGISIPKRDKSSVDAALDTIDNTRANLKIKPSGPIEAGNIDLGKRPIVRNDDGSVSTVRSMSFNDGKSEVLIPTVSDDGRIMTEEQAIQNYTTTGKHLGKFKTSADATAYAEQLHKDQEAQYVSSDKIKGVPVREDFVRNRSISMAAQPADIQERMGAAGGITGRVNRAVAGQEQSKVAPAVRQAIDNQLKNENIETRSSAFAREESGQTPGKRLSKEERTAEVIKARDHILQTTPGIDRFEAMRMAEKTVDQLGGEKFDPETAQERYWRLTAIRDPLTSAVRSGTATLAQGAMDSVPLVADTVNAIVNPWIKAATGEELGPTPRLPGAKYMQEMAAGQMPSIGKKKWDDIKGFDQTSDWLAVQAASQVPQLVGSGFAAFIPKVRALYLTAMGMTSAGGQYQQNLEDGIDSDAAKADAWVNGGIEILSEMLPLQAFDKLKTVLPKLGMADKSKLIGGILEKSGVATLAMTGQMATGAIEESVAQLGQNASNRYIAGNKNTKIADGWKEAAIIGALMGAPLGAAGAIDSLTDDQLMRTRTTAENINSQIPGSIDVGQIDDAIEKRALKELTSETEKPAEPTKPKASKPKTKPAAESPAITADDQPEIVTTSGKPFKTEAGAKLALESQGLADKYEVSPVDNGFALVLKKDDQPVAAIEGEQIDKEWTAFADDSGSLGVPRAEMPQIKAEHRGAMVNFFNARDISHEQVELPAAELKPTQAEFSKEKVQKAKGYTDTDRSILVSADNHVLDGHHQWLAKLEDGEPVKAIRLNAPIKDLLEQVKEFPSASVADGATPAVETKTEQTKPVVDKKPAKVSVKQDPATQSLNDYIAGVKEKFKHGNNKVGETDEDKAELRAQHLDFIETALEEGKELPDSVLVDHADIDGTQYPLAYKKKFGKEPEPPAVSLEKTEQPADAKPDAAHASTDENPVRDIVTRLVKRRAAAQQIGMAPTFDTALSAAKKLMESGDVGARQFEKWQKHFANKDKVLSDIMGELAAASSGTKTALDAKAQKSERAKKMAANAKKIDVTNDDVLAAMAKLGGLKKDAAKSEFGFDPADMDKHGSGIYRTFNNSENAKDLDAMREALAELGYPVGETVADLGNALDDAMSGTSIMTVEGQEAKSQADMEERFNEAYNELSDEEQAILDALVSEATKIFGAERVAEIDATVADYMAGQPIAAIERELTRVLREEIDLATSNKSTDADRSRPKTGESGTGPASESSERAVDEDSTEREESSQEELTLTGQTEDELRASEQAKADQRKADEDAGKKAEADSQVNDFVLTGSNRPADQAAARGARDLFGQQDQPAEANQRIDDLGEKIGGARKDTSTSTGPRGSRPKQEKSEEPAWSKPYVALQSVGEVEGKWRIANQKTGRFVSREVFDTKEEAEAAIPLVALASNHRVYAGNGGHEIWRIVADRKRVKVVDQTFKTNEEAMRYMVENAEAILNKNTYFGEEVLAKPEKVVRKGQQRRTGDISGNDFMDTFGFRGVEFGNWNNQEERQEVMNQAYDGLLDMADILKIPPKAISLNGDLALAFGARGQGLSSARAHYERSYAVMNLTKMKGAGALAHEWFHAMDHYLGRQDGKAKSKKIQNAAGNMVYDTTSKEKDYASYGFSYFNSGARPELRDAFKQLMEGLYTKAEKYVEDTKKAEEWAGRARDELSRQLQAIRADVATERDSTYRKRNNKPATAEQLAELDGYIDRIMNGEFLDTEYRANNASAARRVSSNYRSSNDALDRISEIYKAVRGRGGFNAERTGALDQVSRSLGRYKERLNMLKDAQAGSEKSKKVITQFAMDAKTIDQGRATDYWTTNTEMGARAFSAYIEDKLNELGNQSDFLSFGSDNWRYVLDGIKPFPEGDERKAINGMFDNLFNVIQTKETDKGVALFSRGSSSGMSVDAAQNVVDQISKSWKNAPQIVVVKDMSDERIRKVVRDENDRQLSQGATGQPEGFYDNGKVYVIASEMSKPDDVARVLMHETLGHFGLRGLYGRSLDRILENVVIMRRMDVEKKAKAYGFNMKSYDDRMAAAEEVLAEMAQTNPELPLVKRAIAAIRTWLRENVPYFKNLKLTDAEIIQNYLVPAKRFVQKGKESQDVRDMVVAFQRVWHGSPHRFDKFSLDAIGTGEGAQAYGWGLYFAGKKEVAEYYRNTLSNPLVPQYFGLKKTPFDIKSLKTIYARNALQRNGYDLDKTISRLQELSGIADQTSVEIREDIKALRKIKSQGGFINTGQLYEVEIPEDDTFLLWDKPLSEQPESVKKALMNSSYLKGSIASGRLTGKEIYEGMAESMARAEEAPGWTSASTDSDDRAWSGQERASKYLHSLGIAGIKYLDGSSRGKGDGNYNYVVFDDNLVSIAGTAFSRKNRSPMRAAGDNELTAAMEYLSRDPELFQSPESDSIDIYAIADDIDPGFRVEKLGPSMTKEKNADRAWEVYVPDSKIRAGLVMTNEKNVWVDLQFLREGLDRGNRIYAIAMAYAHNNGKVFIGDPNGLSRNAFYRRNENMLSSALKYGTTRHLMPHMAQMNPQGYWTDSADREFANSVRPLTWLIDDDVNNIKELIYTSYHSAITNVPEIKDVVYDPATEQFQYTDGRPFTNEDSERIAAELSRSARPYRAGSATLKRAALFNTFLRGDGKERGRQALDSLVRQLPRTGLAPSLRGVMYSRSQADTYISEFKENNRRVREENITLWNKSKKWLRRQLSPGGLLPDGVFAEKIKRDSEFQAIEFDVAGLVGGLEKAIKADYKLSAAALDEKTQELLNNVLSGKSPAESVPEQTKIALIGMRQYIDGLSKQYLEGLRSQMNTMIEVADGNEDAETMASLGERIGLYDVIMGNMGQYVHRSYRAFDDPSWAKKVPDQVLDDARRYLIDRNKDLTKEEAERRAEVVINEILKNGTAYDSMDSFIRETKLGAKDLSVLKQRKEIAPQIRGLLGEYTDPRINFAKSATKMGRLIFNQAFLDNVRAMGMGEFLFTDETKPPEATAKLAGDASEVLAPLNGLWVTPEIAQAFKDAVGKEQMADWYRRIVQVNGLVKFGKTVLSPTTAARNWMSAYFFTVANGHFDVRHIGKSVAGLREYFTHGGDAERLAYLRELKQLGVVYDTPYAGEMMRLLADTGVSDALLTGKNMMGVKKALDAATKFYQYGDDFWKIVGFENEKAMWIKAGLSEQDAKVKAAERIRNTYPTYSLVGRGIQSLRRFPLVGTFVSFPAEIIRTSGNMLRYLAEDMADPKTRPMAIKRGIGIALASSFGFALQKLSMALLGFDDDDDEATRLMAAPWQRNANLVYTGRDENGNLRYIDMSFLDPYNYWKRPIMAIMRGQSFEDAVKDIALETLTPFFGTDILAGTLFEIMANKKDTGAPVYKEHEGTLDQMGDITNHLRKAIQPGIANNLERTYKAIADETTATGKKYSLQDELAAWVGFRMSTLDPKTALYYRSFDFKDAKSEADKVIRDVIRDPKDVDDDDLRDAYDGAMKIRQQAYSEMISLVKAASRSGMGVPQINKVLRNSGVSAQDVAALIKGKVPKWRPSSESVNAQAQKAKTMFGDEQARKVRLRYRAVSSYSG